MFFSGWEGGGCFFLFFFPRSGAGDFICYGYAVWYALQMVGASHMLRRHRRVKRRKGAHAEGSKLAAGLGSRSS